jgi:hypothetical protein
MRESPIGDDSRVISLGSSMIDRNPIDGDTHRSRLGRFTDPRCGGASPNSLSSIRASQKMHNSNQPTHSSRGVDREGATPTENPPLASRGWGQEGSGKRTPGARSAPLEQEGCTLSRKIIGLLAPGGPFSQRFGLLLGGLGSWEGGFLRGRWLEVGWVFEGPVTLTPSNLREGRRFCKTGTARARSPRFWSLGTTREGYPPPGPMPGFPNLRGVGKSQEGAGRGTWGAGRAAVLEVAWRKCDHSRGWCVGGEDSLQGARTCPNGASPQAGWQGGSSTNHGGAHKK